MKVVKIEKLAVKQQAVLVDEYGTLDAQKKSIEAKLKEIREKLGDLSVGTVSGEKYDITVSEVPRAVLNVTKVFNKLGERDFLRVVTVSIEKLRNFLLPDEIEKCTATTEVGKKWVVRAK